MKTFDNLYKDAADWLKLMRKNALVGIVYHRDSDGVCSSVMMHKILKFLGCTSVTTLPCDPAAPAVTSTLMKELAKLQPDYLIFLDMAVDQDANPLVLLKQKFDTKIMVIDHHPMSMDLTMLDIKHVNTRMVDSKAYLPASYIMYKIMAKFSSELAGEYSWISMIGTIGDHGVDNCPDLVKGFLGVFGEIASTQKEFSTTKYGKASELIMAAKASDNEGIEKARIMLERAINVDAFLANETLKDWHSEMQVIINHLVNNFEKDAEFQKNANMAIYKINTDKRIESVIASIISDKFPRVTIVVCRESADRISCSLRNQKSVDVGSLAKAAITGLKDARGGGHPQAAAASVLKKDWATFKNALIGGSGKYASKVK
ncbi:MAG: DHHA1 domain-containing protein [Candidatus Aenigmatarchaeota archaeon]